MSDKSEIEHVAAIIDPGAWADDMPVPTRAATIEFHQRRQASAGIAKAVIQAIRASPPKP